MSKSQELKFRGAQQGNQSMIEGKYYQGALPSPEMMLQYQQVDPTLPNRIVSLMEDEAKHRRGLEKRIVRHAFASFLAGNICGLLAILSIGALAYLFMINGHSEDGRWIAVSIAGVVGIFVIRRYMTSGNGKGKPAPDEKTNK